MSDIKSLVFWFVTGSQDLYGQSVLQKVDEHSQIITEALNKDSVIPFKIIFKPVVKNPEAIRRICLEANSDDSCL